MGKLRSFSAIAFSSLTLVVACSSSSSGSSVLADQAATDVSQAFCAKYNSCAPFFVTATYGDIPTCQTRFKLSVLPTLTANGTGATSAQYESCSTDLAAATCESVLSRNLPTSCQTLAGTLADGTSCGDDAQCKDKLCRKGTGQTCGACSSQGAAGSACLQDSDCAYGLGCNNAVCGAYAVAGGSCATTPCDPTLACVNGSCATPGEAGATCSGLGQPGCDTLKGLFCNASKVCAQIATGGSGQPCGLVGTAYTICSAGGLCKGANGATAGTCAATAADGAACDATNGPPCLSPAVCTSGVCKITDPSACN